MRFTDQARALLEHLEGCRLTAYQDEAGVWTIGYGHTGPEVKPGLTWSPAQADAALSADLQRFILGVSAAVEGEPLSDSQFSALVIFAFNVGLMAFRGSSALRALKLGQVSKVPQLLALWNKVHDRSGVPVVSQVLVKRRAAEGDLWRTA